ncbi:unnamed protein product [Effrenium voratum]|uniref:Uncharacterized protein n=1 Tax=Effrenium voratum TaxID=2562239 RepID=A0AA36I3G1_9DINO|nr:unnamed protein product [Effrenium voratum]
MAPRFSSKLMSPRLASRSGTGRSLNWTENGGSTSLPWQVPSTHRAKALMAILATLALAPLLGFVTPAIATKHVLVVEILQQGATLMAFTPLRPRRAACRGMEDGAAVVRLLAFLLKALFTTPSPSLSPTRPTCQSHLGAATRADAAHPTNDTPAALKVSGCRRLNAQEHTPCARSGYGNWGPGKAKETIRSLSRLKQL